MNQSIEFSDWDNKMKPVPGSSISIAKKIIKLFYLHCSSEKLLKNQVRVLK